MPHITLLCPFLEDASDGQTFSDCEKHFVKCLLFLEPFTIPFNWSSFGCFKHGKNCTMWQKLYNPTTAGNEKSCDTQSCDRHRWSHRVRFTMSSGSFAASTLLSILTQNERILIQFQRADFNHISHWGSLTQVEKWMCKFTKDWNDSTFTDLLHVKVSIRLGKIQMYFEKKLQKVNQSVHLVNIALYNT